MISQIDDQLKKYIDRALECGTLSQSYIFEGTKGTGRTELAMYLAKSLLCTGEKPQDKPCGACHACRLIDNDSHPDCIVVKHESAKAVSVNDIREQIVEDAVIRPYYGGKKIYIIPDAGLMTPEAQNALLKTMEEPPSYVHIILIADNRELLLQTIRSRCVTLSFRAEPEFHAEDEAVAEQFIRMGNIISPKGSNNMAELMNFAKELSSDYAEYLPELFDHIERICRDHLFAKSGVILTEKPGTGYIDRTSEISYEGLEKILKAVKQARHDIRSKVAAELVLDSLFLSIKQACSSPVS